MGLRGPLPTPPHLRSVHGSRRRRVAPSGLAPEVEYRLLARAEQLDRSGLKLLKRAERKPTVKTPSNGEQASPLIAAALKVFEAADRIYMRLGRMRPEAEGEATADADPLEAFRRAKH